MFVNSPMFFVPAPAEGQKEIPPNSFAAKFVLGGLAAMTAACITNPIDVMKIRLQSQGEGLTKVKGVDNRHYKGFIRGAVTVVKEEGISGLYKVASWSNVTGV